MTKIVILGQEPKQEKKLKPIEFKSVLLGNLKFGEPLLKPIRFKYIELICLNYCCEHDLIFAYDENRSGGCFYVGHFNDGVVE